MKTQTLARTLDHKRCQSSQLAENKITVSLDFSQVYLLVRNFKEHIPCTNPIVCLFNQLTSNIKTQTLRQCRHVVYYCISDTIGLKEQLLLFEAQFFWVPTQQHDYYIIIHTCTISSRDTEYKGARTMVDML